MRSLAATATPHACWLRVRDVVQPCTAVGVAAAVASIMKLGLPGLVPVTAYLNRHHKYLIVQQHLCPSVFVAALCIVQDTVELHRHVLWSRTCNWKMLLAVCISLACKLLYDQRTYVSEFSGGEFAAEELVAAERTVLRIISTHGQCVASPAHASTSYCTRTVKL